MSFCAHVLGHVGQATRRALLEQQRQEVDLEEHVAELVEELAVVAALGRVGQLVGLLERVGDDRALVLLAVPRALDPQAPRQLVERYDRPGGGRGGRLGDTRRQAPAPTCRRRPAPWCGVLLRRAACWSCAAWRFCFGAFLQSSVS